MLDLKCLFLYISLENFEGPNLYNTSLIAPSVDHDWEQNPWVAYER